MLDKVRLVTLLLAILFYRTALSNPSFVIPPDFSAHTSWGVFVGQTIKARWQCTYEYLHLDFCGLEVDGSCNNPRLLGLSSIYSISFVSKHS